MYRLSFTLFMGTFLVIFMSKVDFSGGIYERGVLSRLTIRLARKSWLQKTVNIAI